MRVQTQQLNMLPRVAEQWIEIALDETQEPVTMETTGQSAQVMVIHVKLHRLSAWGQQVQSFSVVLPTVVLPGTTTDDILGGLMERLPVSLEQLNTLADRTTFFLNTDSFGSCLKLTKCLATKFACFSCPCRMHQLCIAMTAAIALSGVMSSLYCGSLLLRRAKFQKSLRARLEHYLRDNLDITYDAPTSSAVSHANAVWNLAWPLVQAGHSTDTRLTTPKAQAWRRLRKNLCGPLNDHTRVIHYCPYGCHDSRSDVVDEVFKDLCTLFLDSPPMVPVWNKWTKVVPPLMWFAPFMLVHGLLSHIVKPVLEALEVTQVQTEAVTETAVTAMSLIESELERIAAPEQDSEAFRKEEFARVRKFTKFATCKGMKEKLTATLLSLQPALKIMGSFFTAADATSCPDLRRTSTVLVLSQPSQSPAVSTVKVLLNALSSEDACHWQALREPDAAWDCHSYTCAATPTWLEVGQLYGRLVLPFSVWPFKAALMLEDGVSRETQEMLATELLRLCSHRDPFLQFLKGDLQTETDVLDPANLQRIRQLLDLAPVTNVVSEKSFAASHVRRMTDHGQSPKLPTLAAQHVLAESKSILDCQSRQEAAMLLAHGSAPGSAVSQGTSRVLAPGSAVSQSPLQTSAVSQNPDKNHVWRHYMRRHMQAGKTMKQVAQQWRQESDEAKALLAAEVARAPRPPASPQLAVPVTAPVAPATVSVWPHCGDDFYPLRADCLESMVDEVRPLAESWVRRVGETECKPMTATVSDCGPLCRTTKCVRTLQDWQSSVLEHVRVKLNRFAAFCKAKPPNLGDMWPALPALHIHIEASSGSSADRPKGLTLLQLSPLHDAQVYCLATPSAAPVPAEGVVLQFEPQIDNLRGATEVMELCLTMLPTQPLLSGAPMPKESLQFQCLRCKHTSLTSMRVQVVEDMADMEAAAASKRRKDKQASDISAAVQRLDDDSLLKKRRRMRSKQPSRKAAARPSGCQPEPLRDEEVEREEELRMWDDELAAEADPVAGDPFLALEEEIVRLGFPDDELDDMRQAEREELITSPTQPSIMPSSRPSTSNSAGSHGRPEQLPSKVRIDPVTGRVFRTDREPNQYIGRISTIKQNTPQEAFSVYCGMHGCQLMRLACRCPSRGQILQWFEDGLELPKSRETAVQRKHKSSFPEPAGQ
ncbi:unnamed protein product [Symbiodinium microadriaticum]|nr:unnamed protein product [Symbiodinium microadriaticum]